MNRIQQMLTRLSPEQRQKYRALAGLDGPGVANGSHASGRTYSHPLSLGQESVWLALQIQQAGPAYNVPYTFRIDGQLSQQALRQAVASIVERHDVLRTKFIVEDDQPVAVVAPALSIDVKCVSLEHATQSRRWTLALNYLQRHAAESLAPDDPPLLRIVLLRLSEKRSVLQIVAHHLITDMWSFNIFARELQAFYRHHLGEGPAPAPLTMQYADFARWQRQQDFSPARRYWIEHLGDYEPASDLPYDFPRPAGAAHRGAEIVFGYPADVSAQAMRLARREGMSLFMVLVTAWFIVHHKFSGTTDICIGSRSAARSRAELENLVGFFVNALALRVTLTPTMTTGELLHRVKQTVLQAVKHQDYPIEHLYSELNVRRDISVGPLFSVMLSMQNAPATGSSGGDLNIQPLRIHNRTAKFELDLAFDWNGTDLTAIAEFSTDLFAPQTVERLLAAHVRALQVLCTSKRLSMREVALLTRSQPDAAGSIVAGAGHKPLPEVSLPALFSDCASRHPGRVAFRCAGRSLTYRDLQTRANAVAHFLARQDIGPEAIVALCLERDLDYFAWVLGVVMSGAAFLPLDTDYPPAFTRSVLIDACPDLLITAQSPALFESLEGLRTVRPGEVSPPQAQAPLAPITTSADNLAAVIYTSGSTGRPKGVLVSNAQLLNRLFWTWQFAPFQDGEVMVQRTSAAFSVSLWETFGGLLKGVPTVIVRRDDFVDFDRFLAILRSEKITRVHLLPAHLRLLLERAGQSQSLPDSVAIVSTAGEPLPRTLFSDVRQAFPALRILNEYGTTETNNITVFDSSIHAPSDGDYLSVGATVGNTDVYVLDPQLDLVPRGVVGDVFVSSAGAARGYLGQAAATATAFVPNAFSNVAGSRLYRTGDRGRVLHDGSLEVTGRAGNEINIQGCRVEFRQVETALCSIPAVNCAAVSTKRSNGHQSLVAFVVPQSSERLEAETLRSALSRRLPLFMLPTTFVFLDALPLLPNGKLDRAGLAKFDVALAATSGAQREPLTELQQDILRMWREVLPPANPALHDNFFATGGDSILAVRLTAACVRAGIPITVKDLFQHPTVAALSRFVESSSGTGSAVGALTPFEMLPPLLREQLPPGLADAYPISTLQAGMLYHNAAGTGGIAYHNVFSCQLQGAVDAGVLREAIASIVAEQPTLRTDFDELSNQVVQRVHQTVEIIPAINDIAHLPADEQTTHIAQWIENKRTLPWPPRPAPLFYLQLFLRSANSFQYVAGFHHALMDGWSLALFNTMVFDRYQQLLAGKTIQRTALEPCTDARDAVALELKALAEPASRTFWSALLRDASVTRLNDWREDCGATPQAEPLDTGPQVYRCSVFRDSTARLRSICRELGVPQKTVLLAVHLKVLNLLSGSADVLTTTVNDNRPESGHDNQALGLFINTLPFRITLTDCSWAALIRQVFALEVQILSHRRTPIAAIQEWAEIDANQILFNFVNFHIYSSVPESAGLANLGAEYFGNTNFPLEVNFSHLGSNDQLQLSLIYDPNVYAAACIDAIATSFERCIESLLTDLHAMHASAPQRLAGSPRFCPATPFPLGDIDATACVHQLFQRQVRKTPDAPALSCGEVTLSYSELDHLSDQLAGALESVGATEQSPIAVLLERSTHAVVALLGVLKTGCAYLPIDADTPVERTGEIVRHAQCDLILVNQQRADAVAHFGATPIIVEDVLTETAQHMPVRAQCSLNSLAYVIYTSGSTGEPKGVRVPHGAVSNFLSSAQHVLGCGASDPWLATTSLGFDIAALEIFLPLSLGAHLVFTSEQEKRSTRTLAQLVTGHGIKVLQFTPAGWQLLLASGWRSPHAVKAVCGGDVLAPKLANALLDAGVHLWNFYGPTETCIYSACQKLAGSSQSASVPIGAPLANTRLYVLDSNAQRLPPGVTGELYIGGAGLSHGYQQAPGQTAATFIPDPFSRSPGQRMYRTGDYARYLADGSADIVGRTDDQLKIRGYRIEPGQIEAAIMRLPFVDGVAVLRYSPKAQADAALVAFVTAHDESVEEHSCRQEILSALARRLPRYMLPNRVVLLSELPLTASGKIDRCALLEQHGARLGQTSYSPPANAIEAWIIDKWQELLDASQIGALDNFFDIGGNSLAAMRFIMAVEKAFHVRLPFTHLFDAPTTRQIAMDIEISAPLAASGIHEEGGPQPEDDVLLL